MSLDGYFKSNLYTLTTDDLTYLLKQSYSIYFSTGPGIGVV